MTNLLENLIIVDARPLAFPGTGNATYLHRMLKQLVRLMPETHWLLAAHRGIHSVFADLLQAPNLEVEVQKARMGAVWLHGFLPRLLKKRQASLFWGTLAMMPFHYRQRCGVPSVVNFHDLNAWVAPKTMQGWNRIQHRLLGQAAIRESDRVLCLSKTTRKDILRHFPQVPENKLAVVYPGSELPYTASRPPVGAIQTIKDFFLCVGTLEPRKNQATLLEGYLQASKQTTVALPPLLFVGRKGWGDDSLYRQLKGGALETQNVWFLEDADEAELRWCYENCSLVVLPSLHEGFGLPVLEAHALGKPTLLSDIPIFREIGKESLFAAPRKARSWAEALQGAIRLQQSARLKSPTFDSDFWSWRTRARHLQGVLENIIISKLEKEG